MFHTKNHNRSNKPVVNALLGFPKGLCDNCLASVVGMTRNDAITPARRLLGPNKTIQDYGRCERCKQHRQLTRLALEAKVPSPEAATNTSSVKLGDLDATWRVATEYLDSLDGALNNEGFATRIEKLREARKIAPTFAALLLTCLTYRHEMRYHSFEASTDEENILMHVRNFLDEQLSAPR